MTVSNGNKELRDCTIILDTEVINERGKFVEQKMLVWRTAR
jgi:hypothetical protein